MTAPAEEGGEAACWAHLFEEPLPDIGGRAHVEQFVRDFYRQAAMDDAELAKARARKMATAMQRLLDGVSDAGDAPIEVYVTASPDVG